MYLGKSFSKTKSVKSFVKRDDPTYPKKLKQEELDVLVSRLKNGDSEAERKLFNAHVRIGMSIVGKYAYQLSKNYPIDPNLEDDLINEMCVGIMLGIKRAAEKLKDNNITGFIIIRIHKRLSSFIKKEYRIHKRIMNMGELDDMTVEQKTNTKKDLKVSVHNKQRTNKDNTKIMELMEIIYACIKTGDEHKVFNLRRQGYLDNEIGEIMGLTERRISQIRSKIGKRFKRYVQ